MNLYRGLGDGHLARDGLVGITLYQAAQNRLLARRQRWRVAAAQLWNTFDRSKLGPGQFSLVATIITIVVISVSIIRGIFVVSWVASMASLTDP